MKNKFDEFNENLKKQIYSLGIKSKVYLIAASKYYGKDEIINLYNKGQKHFGENKLQEALPKIHDLINFDIIWHFFGHVQTNKAKKIAEYFSYIHSVDSLKIADLLNKYAIEFGKELNIFLQVNLAEEKQKFGFKKDNLLKSISTILQFKALNIMGLMLITPNYKDLKDKRELFKNLKKFQDEINTSYGTNFRYLSMGMSEDWKEALSEGATHLRVGRALFE